MIELQDYLEIMNEYRSERFEQYCTYCQKCMYKVYSKWVQQTQKNNNQNYYSNRDLKDITDETWMDEIRGRDLGETDYHQQCYEYDTCMIYENLCGGEPDDEFSEYFECTQVESNNGQIAYVGPHCGGDGYTVQLGVYSDEYCNEYIGDGVNIAKFVEDAEEDSLLEYVSGTVKEINEQSLYSPYPEMIMLPEYGFCIPCREADQAYERERKYSNNDDDDAINSDEVDVNELCTNLYMVSARCDEHYRSWTNKYKQNHDLSTIQDLSCDFIDSVVVGNYDEMGFVQLSEQDVSNPSRIMGMLQGNMYAEEYGHYVTEVSPLQIAGLVASLLALVLLGAWAVALRKSLSNGTAGWRPRRGVSSDSVDKTDEVMMNRSESGVAMDRSRSAYYAS
eukprot:g1268.t1 g1268   contig10:1742719-1744061(+)